LPQYGVWSQDLLDIFSSSHGLTDSGVAGHAFGLRGVDLGFPLRDGALSGPGCRDISVPSQVTRKWVSSTWTVRIFPA
jgi:hypothetical protein